MLDVVQHQQHLFAAQIGQHALLHRQAAYLWQMERLGDRRGDEGGIGERVQRDEGDAVGEPRGEIGRDLQGHAGLADAAWPRQRHQADIVAQQEGTRRGDLPRPADEPAARHGQRGGTLRSRRLRRAREAFRQQQRQVVGDEGAQLVRRREVPVGGDVLRLDAVEQRA